MGLRRTQKSRPETLRMVEISQSGVKSEGNGFVQEAHKECLNKGKEEYYVQV